MINETTYFVSKLEHSPYHNTFPFYLSATMSLANFAFLTHATFYAPPAPSNTRINKSVLTVIVMLAILTVSPMFPFSGGTFFGIVILNGIIQSAAGAYFQTALVGIGALFGASTLQSLFSGQAASGVIVSVIQFISVLISVKDGHQDLNTQDFAPSQSLAAATFFGVTTVCMIAGLVAHSVLQQTPSYRTVVLAYEQGKGTIAEGEGQEEAPDENEPFISQSVEVHTSGTVKLADVARANVVYNAAVACVFIITLASRIFVYIPLRVLRIVYSLYSLPLRAPSFR